MSSTSDDSLPPPMQEPVGVPAPPPVVAPQHEAVLAQLAREFLQEKRVERRWRTVFRMFWLLLSGLLVYSLWLQGKHVTPTTAPHTALVEVRGEIAADTEASAELLLASNAGVASVGVSFGAHDHETFAEHKPLFVAHSTRELHDWLIEHA